MKRRISLVAASVIGVLAGIFAWTHHSSPWIGRIITAVALLTAALTYLARCFEKEDPDAS